MKDNSDVQGRFKVLTKLYANGIVGERGLMALNAESILHITGITLPDIRVILDLQKAVRAGRLYSYLAGSRPGRKCEFARGWDEDMDEEDSALQQTDL